MKKGLMSILLSFAVLAVSAANYTISTDGDVPWTQSGTTWTSGCCSDWGQSSRLTLTVEAPCMVTYSIQADEWTCGTYSVDGCERELVLSPSPTMVTEIVHGSGLKSLVWDTAQMWMCNSYPTIWISDIAVESAPATVFVAFQEDGSAVEPFTRSYRTSGSYGYLPVPRKSGWTFAGWYTAARGGRRIVEDDPVDWTVTRLFAHWSVPLSETLTVGPGVSLSVDADDSFPWHGARGEGRTGGGAVVLEYSMLQRDASGYSIPLDANFSVWTYGRGTLSFWCKTENWCSVRCLVDVSWSDKWNGETGGLSTSVETGGVWREVQIRVSSPGDHQIVWAASELGRGGRVILDDIRWTPAPESVLVTFDANGGSLGTGTRTYWVSEGYDYLPEPSRPSWNFIGWYTKPQGGRRIVEGDDVDWSQTRIYAQWSVPLEEALTASSGLSLSIESDDGTLWHAVRGEGHTGGTAIVLDRPMLVEEDDYRYECDSNFSLGAEGAGTLSFYWKVEGTFGSGSGECVVDASWSDRWKGESVYLPAGSSWQKVSIPVLGEGWHSFVWGVSWCEEGCRFLLDDIRWTPAPSVIEVGFKTRASGVWLQQVYAPGDCFGDLPEPTRSGYVFGGWSSDPDLTQVVSRDDRVPFEGAMLYAIWLRPLASVQTAIAFANCSPEAEWQIVDKIYTTGEQVYWANLADGWASMEATVTGSKLLDLILSISSGKYGSAWVMTIDGQERAYASAYSDVVPGQDDVQLALGSGTHTIRVEASGFEGTAIVSGLNLSPVTSCSTLGEWFARLEDRDCWTTGNLPSLQAKAATQMQSYGEQGYKAALEHAMATLLAVGEDPLVAKTVKEFGFDFDYVGLAPKGRFDYSRVPALNRLVDSAFPKVKAAVETALADLERIPSVWRGTVKFTPAEYPIDAEVSVDAGDVLYLKALLKGVLATANWVKAYNAEVDWKRGEADLTPPKLAQPTVCPSEWSDDNWGEPIRFSGAAGGEDLAFHVAYCQHRLYVKIPKCSQIHRAWGDVLYEFRLTLSDGRMEDRRQLTVCGGFLQDFRVQPSGEFYLASDNPVLLACLLEDPGDFYPRGESCEIEHVDAGDSDIFVVDVSETDLAREKAVRHLGRFSVVTSDGLLPDGTWGRGYLSWNSGNPQMVAVANQTKVLDKVRDAAALLTSKQLTSEALRLVQSADSFILSQRTVAGVCLFNYDDADETALAAMRSHVATALRALEVPQRVDWTQGLSDGTVEKSDLFGSPLLVDLGALFSGKVTQALLPKSSETTGYVPRLGRMRDPTLGGLLPELTHDDWLDAAEARGWTYDAETSLTETVYPGETVALDTGIVGATQVVGLPAGLKYDKATGWVKGVATTPTGPSGASVYLLSPAGYDEMTIVVADLPRLWVDVDAPISGCTATGSGAYAVGKKVTLKAAPAKGMVFAGWFEDDVPLADAAVDYRTASYPLVIGREDREITALFATAADDAEMLSVDNLWDEEVDGPWEKTLEVSSYSIPTVTVKGLPKGLSFNAKTLTISGTPTAPGFYTVSVSLKNQSVKTAIVQTFTIEVPNLRNEMFEVADLEFEPGVSVAESYGSIDFRDAYRAILWRDPTATLSVTGLPKGLSYDAKGQSVGGTPTAPGRYTVTFTAKGKVIGTVLATATYTVLPFPELVVRIPEEVAGAGGAVTGSGNYLPGSKVTLKATVPKGYVFAGWCSEDESFYEAYTEVQRKQNPFTYVAQRENPEIWAEFIAMRDDWCWVEALFEGDEATWTRLGFYEPVDRAVGVSSGSTLTSLKVTGLPKGLKFDARTGRIAGQPTEAGFFYVTVEAKNASGYQHSAVYILQVGNAPVPDDGCLPGKPSGGDIDLGLQYKTRDYDEGDYVWTNVTAGEYFWDDLYDDICNAVEESYYCMGIKSVKVTGLPAGLKFDGSVARVVSDGDCAYESLPWHVSGVPTKPGVYTMKIAVALDKGPTLNYQYSFIVRNPGSAFVDVRTECEGAKVSGTGVYPIGSTVKLSATAPKGMVFAGWDAGELASDWRQASNVLTVSGPTEAWASFVPSEEDDFVKLGFRDLSTGDWLGLNDEGVAVWRADSPCGGRASLEVDSCSLPKVTVKGLPAGFKFDAARNEIYYVSQPTKPGVYRVTVSVQNQSGAKAAGMLDIVVPNVRSDVFDGLEYEEPYVWTAGESDCCRDPPGFSYEWGWKVTASGLPSGLKLADYPEYGYACFTGMATKPGTYTVTLTAKRGKETQVATVTVVVRALPTWTVGRFGGVLGDPDAPRGLFAMEATAAGKLTATLTFADGTKKSYVANGWGYVGEDVAEAYFSKTGTGYCNVEEMVSVTLSEDVPWDSYQLTGGYKVDACRVDGSGEICAQRSPFGKVGKDYENPEAHEIAAELALYGKMAAYAQPGGSYGDYVLSCPGCIDFPPWSPRPAPNVTVTVGQDGTVKLAGRIGSVGVSASAPLQVVDGEPRAYLLAGPKASPFMVSLQFNLGYGAAGAVTGTAQLVW